MYHPHIVYIPQAHTEIFCNGIRCMHIPCCPHRSDQSVPLFLSQGRRTTDSHPFRAAFQTVYCCSTLLPYPPAYSCCHNPHISDTISGNHPLRFTPISFTSTLALFSGTSSSSKSKVSTKMMIFLLPASIFSGSLTSLIAFPGATILL